MKSTSFWSSPVAPGLLLGISALLALLLANSPAHALYDALLDTPVEVRVGQLQIAKPLLLWINDGLMAVFFFHVGLEIKREFLYGRLSRLDVALLPGVAAVAGMLVPAMIYAAINWSDPQALNGWAIPSATDIAFSLGVLALLGTRVPASLKVFLLALAILDDLGAIIVIALFYSGDLSAEALYAAGGFTLALVVANRIGVRRLGVYAVIGIALWVSVLKSGVHATLAGVVLALAMPMPSPETDPEAPVHRLEHAIAPWASLFIVPLFAFANAGVALHGVTLERLLGGVPFGIIAGLVLGKPLGVLVASWLAVRFLGARLPEDMSWRDVLGVGFLCGIGFTMSLFIGGLAFEHGGFDYMVDVRLGVLCGSLIAAVVGYAILHRSAAQGC